MIWLEFDLRGDVGLLGDRERVEGNEGYHCDPGDEGSAVVVADF